MASLSTHGATDEALVELLHAEDQVGDAFAPRYVHISSNVRMPSRLYSTLGSTWA